MPGEAKHTTSLADGAWNVGDVARASGGRRDGGELGEQTGWGAKERYGEEEEEKKEEGRKRRKRLERGRANISNQLIVILSKADIDWHAPLCVL